MTMNNYRRLGLALISGALLLGQSMSAVAAGEKIAAATEEVVPVAGVSIILDGYYSALESGTASKSAVTTIKTTVGLLQPISVLDQYSNIGVANVNNYLNIRKEPNTSGEIVGKLTAHGGCEIIEESNGWFKVKSGPVTGYVSGEFLMTGELAQTAAVENASLMAKISTDALRVRTEPDLDARIWTLVYNTEMYNVVEQLDGWVKIEMDTSEGYISTEYVDVIYALPEATKYSIVDDISATRQNVVKYAMQFLGNRYVWGGTNPNTGADCSGFTQYVLRNGAGVSISRTSRAQANNGTVISASEMRPGDLVFYSSGGTINHVAMYIGNGQVIHASNARSGIKISSYNYRTPVKIVNVIGG